MNSIDVKDSRILIVFYLSKESAKEYLQILWEDKKCPLAVIHLR